MEQYYPIRVVAGIHESINSVWHLVHAICMLPIVIIPVLTTITIVTCCSDQTETSQQSLSSLP